MVSAGTYAVGVAALAAIALSLGCSAVLLRRRLLPDWTGAPAHLIDAILGVALLLWISQLLGIAGLLHAWTLVAASLLLAGVLAGLLGRGVLSRAPSSAGGTGWGDQPEERQHRRAGGPNPVTGPADQGDSIRSATGPAGPDAFVWLVTAGVIALVFAHWGLTTKDALDRGIFNFDSLWYHMPFAVEMAQSHSVGGLHYTDTVFTNWFYPHSSELLHAVGILLTERDTLSLFLNFGWLAIAFLAAWCIGRPYGRGHLTVLAAAILLECHTLVVREPGAAKNDLMAAALVLAAVAILVNAWAVRPRREPGGERSLPPGWPLAAAGLAVGMAVGTKFTVLAMAAALTVAVLALAPSGRRPAALAWWALPAFMGGGYWYVRNLFAVGNPVPHIQQLGPISLPGPERLQTARPDFSIAHYATDTGVWSEWFAPGLQDQLGVLWPLVLGGAVLGAALAFFRGDRALRWAGAVALLGLLAYVFTPLSAAGAEGAPVAFEINLRFGVPALLLALVLLPISLLRHHPSADGPETGHIDTFSAHRPGGGWGWEWGLALALVAVLVVTDRADAVARDPARVFAACLATLLVLVPAALLYARRRRASFALVSAGFASLALVIAGIGYPVQRDYLEDRFANRVAETSVPGFGLDPAYRWARRQEDVRIGLAGTTAGFLQYGFYGTDLSNEVVYLGERGPEGAFNAIRHCAEFRDAVNSKRLDYLVTSPFLNFIETGKPIPSPEARWLRGEEGAVTPVLRHGPVTVWRLRGELDPLGCDARNAPLHELPNAPGTEPPPASQAPKAPPGAGPILAGRPRLAILGDSYSAGEGADVYLGEDEAGDHRCHRSRHTYLVEAFGLPSRRIVACSGAVTPDVSAGQPSRFVYAQRVRLASIRDEGGVDAVVLTLGGNDLGFRHVVTSCLFGDCTRSIRVGLTGRPQAAAEFVDGRLASLGDALLTAYEAIDRVVNGPTAPATKPVPILVLAYPLATPRESRRDCEPMKETVSKREQDFLNVLVSDLNDAVREAVGRARAAGARTFFVGETEDAFQPDNTICDEDAYVRSLRSFNGGGITGEQLLELPAYKRVNFLDGIQELVHPNRAGYEAMTRAILRWSREPEAATAQRLLEEPRR